MKGARERLKESWVYAWCESLKVEVGFQEREGILEGHFGINGRWYEKNEVSSLGELTAKLMENGVFVSQFGTIVSGFDFDDRVVLVGDDIIWDSLDAPYKFFIDTLGKKSPAEASWMIHGRGGDANDYRDRPTFFSYDVLATFINGEERTVGDCVMIALVECVIRANELGFLKVPLEEAYFLAANWGGSVRITVDRLMALS